MRYEFDGGSVELDHDGQGENPFRWSADTEWFVEVIELDCGLRIDRRDPCHLPVLSMHDVQPHQLDVFFWDEALS